jgi:glutathione S-transferase
MKTFFSLLLFIAVSIPHAILSKIRSKFPRKYQRTTVVALPYSPFCEKVFWAYQRCKVPYDMRVVFQGFFPTTLMEFSAATIPITVDANGRVITDSKDVLNALDAGGHSWLYPSPAVREVESGFGDAFGRAVARIVYHHLFTSDKGGVLLRRVWKVEVSAVGRFLCDPLYPACRFAMYGGMGLPGGLPGFIATVDEVFDRVSSLLKDGRKYLCSTPAMTAADVTFAALAYPLVLPEEKAGVFVSWADDLPEEFRTEVTKRRETLAGQFVLRLYKEERHV